MVIFCSTRVSTKPSCSFLYYIVEKNTNTINISSLTVKDTYSYRDGFHGAGLWSYVLSGDYFSMLFHQRCHNWWAFGLFFVVASGACATHSTCFGRDEGIRWTCLRCSSRRKGRRIVFDRFCFNNRRLLKHEKVQDYSTIRSNTTK